MLELTGANHWPLETAKSGQTTPLWRRIGIGLSEVRNADIEAGKQTPRPQTREWRSRADMRGASAGEMAGGAGSRRASGLAAVKSRIPKGLDPLSAK